MFFGYRWNRRRSFVLTVTASASEGLSNTIRNIDPALSAIQNDLLGLAPGICQIAHMKAVITFLAFGILNVHAASVAETNKKLETIVLPQVQLADVPFPEAVEYLRQKAVTLDPEKKGFNVVLQVPKENPGLQSTVTLSLSNVPVGVALDYATRMANLRYKVDSFAVVILPLEK